MNILIDIGHPAHVHYYKNLAKELSIKGHKIIWTVKEIEIAKHLLDFYDFSYFLFPEKADGLWNKIIKQLGYNIQLLKVCNREKIDIAIGTSVSVAHVSLISKVRSIVFDDDDDDVQPFVTKYVHPFTDDLLSPDTLKEKRKHKNTIYYAGYHELAYLHPKRFTPNPDVLKEVNLKQGETFFLMRFNVFKAHHDTGIQGLTIKQKEELIRILKPYGKVFITTEREIEPELKRYQLKIGPEKIHSLMAYAAMFIGDSQTMTSEAAVLGIPSLRCNSFAGRISYLEEEEHKYQLTFGFKPEHYSDMLIKLKELLAMSDLKPEFRKRRQKMLKDKIDVTAFWTWIIDQYPESIKIMKENPDYQYNFR